MKVPRILRTLSKSRKHQQQQDDDPHSVEDDRGSPNRRAGKNSDHRRDHLPPADLHDLLDRQLSQATESNERLTRYLKLFAALAVTTMLGALMFAIGIGAAASLAGLSSSTATSIGATGAVATLCAAIIWIARKFRKY